MNHFKNLNLFSKTIITLGLILVISGFAFRLIPVYFFWESISIGWIILLIGIVSVLREFSITQKAAKKKTVWLKIGSGFIVVLCFIELVMFVVIPQTDAYLKSINYIYQNSELNSEIGEVKETVFIPGGGISVQNSSKGGEGSASISFIVHKSSKKR